MSREKRYLYCCKKKVVFVTILDLSGRNGFKNLGGETKI